jgi:hypothetical protein
VSSSGKAPRAPTKRELGVFGVTVEDKNLNYTSSILSSFSSQLSSSCLALQQELWGLRVLLAQVPLAQQALAQQARCQAAEA